METVQIQCGSCNKLMAINTQHLGSQVRCPHCQAVVQTRRPEPALVPASDSGPPPLEIHAPQMETGEVESIFSPPAPTEDLFDAGPQQSLVEMPAEPPPVSTLLPQDVVTAEAPPPQETLTAHAEPPALEGDAELPTAVRPRAPVDRGYVSLMLLIFLVPYSIMMTLFVIYLLYVGNQTPNLEMLPDPAPKKDGARQFDRARHDMPLANSLKVALGKTLRVGEIEVSPRQVKASEAGDLVLVLRAKNVSTDQAFSPISIEFLKTDKSAAPPYTFVETRQFQRLYGARHLDFDRGGNGLVSASEGNLKPGEVEDVILTTNDHREVVKRIRASSDDVTWRVQVRRGLVPARGGKASATAVIGVVFAPRDIVDEVKGG